MNKPRIPEAALQRIKSRLLEIYGDRLRGVMLYGSEARGEAEENSDIDLLVLLDGPVRLAADLEKIINAVYPVQLEIDRIIHATPAEYDTYRAGEYSLYRNVQTEGLPI